MKVFVDVKGYNFSTRSLEDVIKFYKLNPIQIYILKSGKTVVTMGGDVTLEAMFDSTDETSEVE